jgi:Tfp pilus assembly PilM family ATPase
VNPFVDMVLGERINPERFASDIPALLVAAGLSLRGFD